MSPSAVNTGEMVACAVAKEAPGQKATALMHATGTRNTVNMVTKSLNLEILRSAEELAT